MLSKVFEWSRVTNPTPDDAFVEKRKTVITALVEELAKKPALLIDCACAAAGGLAPRFDQQSELVSTIIEAVRAEQPAFPEALAENAMDIRVCCCLIVGEIADRAVNNKNAPSYASQMMSGIIVSGLSNVSPVGGKHLLTMLQGVLQICVSALKRAGEVKRRRYTIAGHIDSVEPNADAAALWTAAKPLIMRMATNADWNASVDREEINTLWWAFNGVSTTKDSALSALPIGEASVRAGAELAALVLLPPLPTTKYLVRRVIAAGRTDTQLEATQAKSLLDWMASEDVSSLSPSSPKTTEFVRENPAIVPISWCCLRSKEGVTNLVGELKRARGMAIPAKVTPEWLAHQAFDERIALRLCEATLG